jgi:Subtilase family
MKARVTVFLNLRTGTPELLPNNNTGDKFFSPGDVIDIIEAVSGESIRGNNVWFKLADGGFVWSGGVALQNPANSFDYKDAVSFLPKAWLNTNGKGSLIVIIDTGVNINNLVFKKNLISEISLVDNSSVNKDHGTFICGMIAGFGPVVKGVAVDSKILSIRYKTTITALEKALDNLIEALNKISDLRRSMPGKRIIVNISQGFNSLQVSKFPEKIERITSSIQTLSGLDILFCCAAGENNELTEGQLLFPALLQEVVSVGCITEDSLTLNLSNKITIITPLQTYKSYDTELEIIPDIGSSFSVAIIASLGALIDSNAALSKKSFIDAIRPFDNKIADFNFDSNTYQFSLQN